MVAFRFLQTTDLHVAVPPPDGLIDRGLWESREWVIPSAARPPLLEALAELVFEQKNTIDALLLTGDLADDGEDRNLKAAHSYVSEQPAAGSCFTPDGVATLAAIKLATGVAPTLFLLPGNHDRFIGVARRPGGNNFDRIFGDHWRKGLGGVQSLSIFKPGAAFAIVTADFCIPSIMRAFRYYLSQGYAADTTLDQLITETETLKRAFSPIEVVWAVHFPPFLDTIKSERLRRSNLVMRAAARVGVRYIIAGHVHRNQNNSYVGVEVISTASATSEHRAQEHGNWAQMFEFDLSPNRRPSVIRTQYQYVPTDNRFEIKAVFEEKPEPAAIV